MRKLVVTFALILPCYACGPAAEQIAGDDDPPLADYQDIFAGAPKNDSLPTEGKADGVYPAQHTELVASQSPVKSQGRRGVCSIFATVGLMEHLYIRAGHEAPDFSEQYLQWSVKTQLKAFPGSSGSSGEANLRAVNKYGIPEEQAWPYEPDQWNSSNDEECTGTDPMPTRCYTNGDPPESAREAKKFFLPASRWLNTNSIKHQITTKKLAVVVGLDFFYQAWNHRKSTLPTTPANWNQGIVLYPNDEDIEESHKQRAGHAIVILGWDDDMEVPRRDKDGNQMTDEDGQPVMEKGFYLFKNSWGTAGFGIDNPHGAGFGWIAQRYVADYGSAVTSDMPTLVNPVGNQKQATFSGSVTKGQEAFHSVALGAKANSIKVVMSGSNDADLYTRFGARPTTTSYECRPYRPGSSETCEHPTAGGQHLEIMVVGWASGASSYSIEVTWLE